MKAMIYLYNFRFIFRTCSLVKKYFSLTRFSKMSDNKHSFSVLWDPEIFAVKHLPFRIIPHGIQRLQDFGKGFSFIMAEKSFDVLKQKHPRLLNFKNPCDFKEESSARIFESLPFASQAESLTREAGGKQVMVWDGFRFDFGDVAFMEFSFSVIVPIDLTCLRVNFIRPNASKDYVSPRFTFAFRYGT